MHWWMFYGLVTIGAVTSVWTDKGRARDSLGAAFLLAGLWVLTNVSHWWVPKPYNQFFPVADSMVSIILVWIWRNSMTPWKFVLILMFQGDCILHAAYVAAGDRSFQAKYLYDLRMNLLYIAQLSAVVFSGSSNEKRNGGAG